MDYRLCVLVIIMIHVAHHGSGAMPTDGSSSTEPTLHLGKSFAHCTKLVKDNYDIWMAGILSLLMGYASYKGIEEVIYLLEKFKVHCGLGLEDLNTKITSLFRVKYKDHGSDRKTEGNILYEANRTMFQILFQTIDPTLKGISKTGAGKLFMDGLA